jgi:DNA-binding FrmR family transcriptional regulator
MHCDKQKTLKLLKTVKGQTEGLIKMVEEDRYCVDISNQLLSTISILKKVNLDILKGHFNHCIKETLHSDDERAINEKLQEVDLILSKILK